MTECVVKNGYELRVYSNQQEIISVLVHGSSNRVLLNFDFLSTFSWPTLHYTKCARRVFTYILYK